MRSAAVALVAIAALGASVLTAAPANADDPILFTGVVLDDGTPVADLGVYIEKIEDNFSPVGYSTTAADGTWSITPYSDLRDGTYALYYITNDATAYSTSQYSNGETDSRDATADFSVSGGVASVTTFSKVLVRNAGAVTVRLVDATTGAALHGEDVPEDGGVSQRGSGEVYLGTATNDAGSISSITTGYAGGSDFAAGVVTVAHVKPGTYYDGGVYTGAVSVVDATTTKVYAGDFLSPITVAVGTTTNYGDASVYPADAPPVRAVLPAPYRVDITGDPKVGTLLTASIPASGATATYQWFSEDGALAGETSQTYAPTTRQLGQNISVSVTVRAAGYRSMRLTDTTKTKVALGDPNAATVAITGTPALNKVLHAVITSPLTSTNQYQWYRNGAPLAGEDSSSYAVTTKDLGKQLVVSITSTTQGHNDAVIPSPAVTVAKDAAKVTAKAAKTVKTSARLKVTVKVANGKSHLTSTSKVRVYYSAKKFKTITVKAGKSKSISLPKLKKGKHTIKVVYLGTSHYKEKTVKFTVKATK